MGVRTHPPPLTPTLHGANSFNFLSYSFWDILAKSCVGECSWRAGAPTSRKFWIRYWQIFWNMNKHTLMYISGIICSKQTWKQIRKFAIHSMRDFGLGKHSIEERTQDEARNLVKQFKSKNGQPFDPHVDLVKAVSNIICSITFGNRLVIWSKIKWNWDTFRKNYAYRSPVDRIPLCLGGKGGGGRSGYRGSLPIEVSLSMGEVCL